MAPFCGLGLSSPLTPRWSLRLTRLASFAASSAAKGRRAKERTYPELLQSEGCRLVVMGSELEGQWSSEASISVDARSQPVPVRPRLFWVLVPRLHTSPAGLHCSRLRQPALWQPASFPSSRWAMLPTSTGLLSISAMLSPRPSPAHRWPADWRCGPRGDLWIFSRRGFFMIFPALDFRSVPRVALEYGFPSCCRTGTADWPEKVRKTKNTPTHATCRHVWPGQVR